MDATSEASAEDVAQSDTEDDVEPEGNVQSSPVLSLGERDRLAAALQECERVLCASFLGCASLGDYVRALEAAAPGVEQGAARPCTAVWQPGAISYRCRTCQTNPSSAICVACFQRGNHEGHDYAMYVSVAGGCCDCGDPASWRPQGCCPLHAPPPPQPRAAAGGTSAMPGLEASDSTPQAVGAAAHAPVGGTTDVSLAGLSPEQRGVLEAVVAAVLLVFANVLARARTTALHDTVEMLARFISALAAAVPGRYIAARLAVSYQGLSSEGMRLFHELPVAEQLRSWAMTQFAQYELQQADVEEVDARHGLGEHALSEHGVAEAVAHATGGRQGPERSPAGGSRQLQHSRAPGNQQISADAVEHRQAGMVGQALPVMEQQQQQQQPLEAAGEAGSPLAILLNEMVHLTDAQLVEVTTMTLLLLYEPDFKYAYTQHLLAHYPEILWKATTGPNRRHLSAALDRLTVQLFNSPDVTLRLVREDELLHVLLGMLDACLAMACPGNRTTVNPDHPLIAGKAYARVLADLRMALAHPRVAAWVLQPQQPQQQQRHAPGAASPLRATPRDLDQVMHAAHAHAQFMDARSRRRGDHVLYESQSWAHAVQLEVYIGLHITAPLACLGEPPLGKDRAGSVGERAFMQAMMCGARRALYRAAVWAFALQAPPARAWEALLAGRVPVSAHLPLHRLAAAFVASLLAAGRAGILPPQLVESAAGCQLFDVNALQVQPGRLGRPRGEEDEGGEEDADDRGGAEPRDVCHPWRVLHQHVLLMLAWLAQVRARLWLRNGEAVMHLEHTYRASFWVEHGLDLDLLLLQLWLAAGAEPPGMLLRSLLLPFGAQPLLHAAEQRLRAHAAPAQPTRAQASPDGAAAAEASGKPAATVPATPGSTSHPMQADSMQQGDADADLRAPIWAPQLQCIVEGLRLAVTLQRERGLLQLDERARLRRQAVAWLALRDLGYARLQALLPDEIANSRTALLDEVLEAVADYLPPDAHQRGRFALKRAAWAEFDPFFTHYSERDRQAALQRAAAAGAWRWRDQLATPPPLGHPLEKLPALLETPLLLRVAWVSLRYAQLHHAASVLAEDLAVAALHLLALALGCAFREDYKYLSAQAVAERAEAAAAWRADLARLAVGSDAACQPGLLTLLQELAHEGGSARAGAELQDCAAAMLERMQQVVGQGRPGTPEQPPAAAASPAGVGAPGDGEAAKEARRAKARARQAELLAQMRAQQAAFASSQAGSAGGSGASTAAAAPAAMAVDAPGPASETGEAGERAAADAAAAQRRRWHEDEQMDEGPPGHEGLAQLDVLAPPAAPAHHPDAWAVLGGECALCQEGADAGPLGWVAQLHCCAIPSMALRDPPHWAQLPVPPAPHQGARGSPQGSASPDSQPEPSSAPGGMAPGAADAPAVRDRDASQNLWLGPGVSCLDARPGLHVLCCGHRLHEACLQQYMDGLRARERTEHEFHRDAAVTDTRAGEFLCPVCRRLGNALLPAVAPEPSRGGGTEAAGSGGRTAGVGDVGQGAAPDGAERMDVDGGARDDSGETAPAGSQAGLLADTLADLRAALRGAATWPLGSPGSPPRARHPGARRAGMIVSNRLVGDRQLGQHAPLAAAFLRAARQRLTRHLHRPTPAPPALQSPVAQRALRQAVTEQLAAADEAVRNVRHALRELWRRLPALEEMVNGISRNTGGIVGSEAVQLRLREHSDAATTAGGGRAGQGMAEDSHAAVGLDELNESVGLELVSTRLHRMLHTVTALVRAAEAGHPERRRQQQQQQQAQDIRAELLQTVQSMVHGLENLRRRLHPAQRAQRDMQAALRELPAQPVERPPPLPPVAAAARRTVDGGLPAPEPSAAATGMGAGTHAAPAAPLHPPPPLPPRRDPVVAARGMVAGALAMLGAPGGDGEGAVGGSEPALPTAAEAGGASSGAAGAAAAPALRQLGHTGSQLQTAPDAALAWAALGHNIVHWEVAARGDGAADAPDGVRAAHWRALASLAVLAQALGAGGAPLVPGAAGGCASSLAAWLAGTDLQDGQAEGRVQLPAACDLASALPPVLPVAPERVRASAAAACCAWTGTAGTSQAGTSQAGEAGLQAGPPVGDTLALLLQLFMLVMSPASEAGAHGRPQAVTLQHPAPILQAAFRLVYTVACTQAAVACMAPVAHAQQSAPQEQHQGGAEAREPAGLLGAYQAAVACLGNPAQRKALLEGVSRHLLPFLARADILLRLVRNEPPPPSPSPPADTGAPQPGALSAAGMVPEHAPAAPMAVDTDQPMPLAQEQRGQQQEALPSAAVGPAPCELAGSASLGGAQRSSPLRALSPRSALPDAPSGAAPALPHVAGMVERLGLPDLDAALRAAAGHAQPARLLARWLPKALRVAPAQLPDQATPVPVASGLAPAQLTDQAMPPAVSEMTLELGPSGSSPGADGWAVAVPPAPRAPELLQLPPVYQDLYLKLAQVRCVHCNKVPPKEAGLCLQCGQVMCLENDACRQRDGFQRRGSGWAALHAAACGAGVDMFLTAKVTTVLSLSASRAAMVPSPYLDDHGEEDPGLRRGRPLHLTAARAARLRGLWLHAAADFDSLTLHNARGGRSPFNAESY